MSTRRDIREWIVQLLFELDLNPREELDNVFKDFWRERQVKMEARSFAEDIVRGVAGKRSEIDVLLQKYAEHWDIARMKVTDRNVMRMALYEMHYREDIPPVVTINEAVDIAKYFSDSGSGKFVNGILDRAREDLDRPSR